MKVNKKWISLFLICSLVLSAGAMLIWDQENSANAATTSFRFVVLGDSRGASDGINSSVLRSLLAKIKGLSTQPRFILYTGDQVQGGSDVETELYEWKNIVDDYYPINVNYPALGNHEHNETIFSNVFNYLPSNQLSGYRRTAYYFDYGNARFITLNSDRTNSSGDYIISSQQRSWLESILRNNGKIHNFIQFHVPAYPIGSHYGESLDASPADRDAFWDIADNYDVTAVIVGHEHNYNRRLIDSSFNRNGYTFTNNVYQLTLGGSGAPLTGTRRDSRNVIVGPQAKYHYMVVDIADEVASFKVYDINNNQLDSFNVTQGTNPPPPPPTDPYEPNNSLSTAYGPLTSGTTYNSLISTSTDQDWYKFTTRASGNISISLSNLPGDYDLFLYNSSGTELARSTRSGTNPDQISYNGSAGTTYYVKVIGWNGAMSTTVQYALRSTYP